MIISTATLRGDGRKNQDTIVVSERAIAVLDGASAWYPQEPGRDGGWYSNGLGSRMMSSLDADRPLADVVYDAIADMRDTFDLTPGTAPECTVTIARWDAEKVEIYVLCDSPAVVFRHEGDPVVILDDRLQGAGQEARKAYRDYLRAGNGYGPDLRPMLAKLQEDEFTQQNREGGYWVAEASPEAAHQAMTVTYPLDQVDAVALLSDGAAAGIEEYGAPANWSQARERLLSDPAGFIADVHQVEDTDPTGQRWPRAKCHDDKAIAVVRPFIAQLPN